MLPVRKINVVNKLSALLNLKTVHVGVLRENKLIIGGCREKEKGRNN
jgi:hypothetical protein